MVCRILEVVIAVPGLLLCAVFLCAHRSWLPGISRACTGGLCLQPQFGVKAKADLPDQMVGSQQSMTTPEAQKLTQVVPQQTQVQGQVQMQTAHPGSGFPSTGPVSGPAIGPPLPAYQVPTKSQSVSDPKIILVSYGVGGPWGKSLENMNKTWESAGFDKAYLWKNEELLADRIVQENKESFEKLRTSTRLSPIRRPFCAAFKPVIVLRAMRESREGDFIVWADSSKHDVMTMQPGIREAVDTLTAKSTMYNKTSTMVTAQWRNTSWYQQLEQNPGTPPRNLYGSLHCWVDCGNGLRRKKYLENQVTPHVTMDPWKSLWGPNFAFFKEGPHVLNSNMIFENTAYNRQLVWDWLQMALTNPRGFCSPHMQDQMAFTILAFKRRLPIANTCLYMKKEKGCCFQAQKKYNTMIPKYIATGAWELTPTGSFPENFEWATDR